MKRAQSITVPIPGEAMEWAQAEAKDVRRRNPGLDFNELAGVLVLRGVIVAATDSELRAALAKVAP